MNSPRCDLFDDVWWCGVSVVCGVWCGCGWVYCVWSVVLVVLCAFVGLLPSSYKDMGSFLPNLFHDLRSKQSLKKWKWRSRLSEKYKRERKKEREREREKEKREKERERER